MKKVIERLLIFFLGIPAVFCLVYFLPYKNFLALNIVATIFSAMGAVELSAMLRKKNINVSKTESIFLGCLAPLAATLIICFNLSQWVFSLIFAAGASWALVSLAVTKKDKMENVIHRFAGLLAVTAYPGFFMYWLIKMGSWGSSAAIILFLVTVFFNDSFAWLIGSLFGKNNRGIFEASPNKSIAGFLGGILGSVGAALGAFLLFSSFFPALEFSAGKLIIMAVCLGLFTGIFASLGDLVESAVKRSCDFKDSGNLILGRGGVLDTIDSISAAAPVFYLLYSLFFANL